MKSIEADPAAGEFVQLLVHMSQVDSGSQLRGTFFALGHCGSESRRPQIGIGESLVADHVEKGKLAPLARLLGVAGKSSPIIPGIEDQQIKVRLVLQDVFQVIPVGHQVIHVEGPGRGYSTSVWSRRRGGEFN